MPEMMAAVRKYDPSIPTTMAISGIRRLTTTGWTNSRLKTHGPMAVGRAALCSMLDNNPTKINDFETKASMSAAICSVVAPVPRLKNPDRKTKIRKSPTESIKDNLKLWRTAHAEDNKEGKAKARRKITEKMQQASFMVMKAEVMFYEQFECSLVDALHALQFNPHLALAISTMVHSPNAVAPSLLETDAKLKLQNSFAVDPTSADAVRMAATMSQRKHNSSRDAFFKRTDSIWPTPSTIRRARKYLIDTLRLQLGLKVVPLCEGDDTILYVEVNPRDLLKLLKIYVESVSNTAFPDFDKLIVKFTEDARVTNGEQNHCSLSMLVLNGGVNPHSGVSHLCCWLGNGSENFEMLKNSTNVSQKLNELGCKALFQSDLKTFWELMEVRTSGSWHLFGEKEIICKATYNPIFPFLYHILCSNVGGSSSKVFSVSSAG